MHSENSIFNIIEKESFLRCACSRSHYILPFIIIFSFKALYLKHLLMLFIYSKCFVVCFFFFTKKLSHCISTYCGFRFLSTKGHKLKVESKTGKNKMQFSDCQNPNIKKSVGIHLCTKRVKICWLV